MRRRCRVGSVTALLLVLCTIACGTRSDSADDRSSSASPKTNDVGRAVAVSEAHPRVVVLGDSLTAGLGFVARKTHTRRGFRSASTTRAFSYTIVNAGVSGDTSAGGLSRLDWALDGDVRVLIVALGGNDGLRGLPPAELTRNLSTIIERAQARGIAVVLAGMEAPPNYGFRLRCRLSSTCTPALAKKLTAWRSSRFC